jgi:hypothetical protein
VSERHAHLEDLVRRYERNRQRLELQIADAGGPDQAELDVINALENTEAMLAGLQAELNGVYSATTLKDLPPEGRTHVILAHLQRQDRWMQRIWKLAMVWVIATGVVGLLVLALLVIVVARGSGL